MTDDSGQTIPYGVLDEALMRPPLVLGCERVPFVITIGISAFATVVVFGLTLSGLFAGILLALAGISLLRRLTNFDPLFFATRIEAAKYPRHMPDVLPDTALPLHLPFVGYEDPPSRSEVSLARTSVAVALLIILTLILTALVPMITL
ncbi:hypothetical protein GTA62_18535 [Roseobacter sp. HKCCD9010]|uniref:VirB3 family type IV secretion system protein n=1 Tax=unclassified Roseobacter TaxID=196798 RepID=UPI001492E807|nr:MULTISPECIES: VirB3 family type IV secretion system protein [unclassified Roseobacter]MBF9051917.1 hypothetical protein [Rhodobacterales bacterium HKCCD4356]NNV13910.1 hypothetical protein [Roseobacter sp. HKCCD7357]NNV18082.1 hypothetical protein [Roseobacter sp. HKCCD8768]NNV27542.1 hypothetical protein [Roseobacter sp. HKCCD8192]NNV31808.1 hypothetical protein [Roseobacter sp. HKCCD9061]